MAFQRFKVFGFVYGEFNHRPKSLRMGKNSEIRSESVQDSCVLYFVQLLKYFSFDLKNSTYLGNHVFSLIAYDRFSEVFKLKNLMKILLLVEFLFVNHYNLQVLYY